MVNAFFIVGPTAVGKTSLAVNLAERFDAEIISADAFQVYHGFDLLTAKPTHQERRRAVHHLIGTVPIAEEYNVARYLREASRCIADAKARGKPVLVVGGSGLYIKALTHGLSSLPPADPALRASLASLSLRELFSRLRDLDPVACATIDRANERRLVRALEVCMLTGKPFSSFRAEWQAVNSKRLPTGVLLFRERADLALRIERRIRQMFAQGVLDEVRCSLRKEVSATARQILGLRDIQEHMASQIDAETCCMRLTTATRQYAKRQVTWFKRETIFETFSLNHFDSTHQQNYLQTRFQRWLDNIGNTTEPPNSAAEKA